MESIDQSDAGLHSYTTLKKEYDWTHCKCFADAWVGLMLLLYIEGCLFTVGIDQETLKCILHLMA